MIDYIKGFIFIIGYIGYTYILGSSLLKTKESAPKRFVVGYIIYATLIAIAGIPIQIFNLSWKMFYVYLLVMTCTTLMLAIYRIYKKKIKLFNENIYNFIKQYWFIFFIAGLLVIISATNISEYWMNNCLDDGYYLNRMATLPYIANPFTTSPATGLMTNTGGFLDPYNYSVFELEASVFIYLLDIMPTLFARCFLAFINYFLFACVLHCFFEKLNELGEYNIDKYFIQYLTLSMIIFSVSYFTLVKYNVHHLQDVWQSNTAMYYGSSIVRCMGLFMLITPFIGKDKLLFKDIMWFGIISFMLMSKSSVALPFIVLSVIVVLSMILLKKNNTRKYFLLLLVLLVFLGIILGNSQDIASTYKMQFINNLKSYLIIVTLLLLVISLFVNRKRIYLEACSYAVLLFIFTLIEPINNVFEKFSIYKFVACRFLTGLYTFVIMLAVFGIAIIIEKIISTNKIKYYVKNSIVIAISILLYFGTIFVQSNGSLGNFKHNVNVFLNNKSFAPSSVIMLGDSLEELAKAKNEKLYALVPEGLGVDGITYSLAISIRQFSPSTVSLSAFARFNTNAEPAFLDYGGEYQQLLANLCDVGDDKAINDFKELLNKYPINCLVTTTMIDDKAQKIGMKKYTEINYQNNYYIYYK